MLGVYLFKKLLVVFCILLMAIPAYSAIYLVEPIDRELSHNEEISFGKIASGETLKIVVKKKTGMPFEWNTLNVDSQLLPREWKFESVETDKTLIGLLSIPKNAPMSAQRIKVVAGNSAEQVVSESFFANLSVNENLLDVSIENPVQETVLGDSAIFKIVVSNDSIADHLISVESSLPNYWFAKHIQTIAPNSTVVIELPVRPYSYGEKGFQFTLSSAHNQKQFLFPAKLNTSPTLSGMFRASIAGFPFFSPGELPFYLINGFISLLG